MYISSFISEIRDFSLSFSISLVDTYVFSKSRDSIKKIVYIGNLENKSDYTEFFNILNQHSKTNSCLLLKTLK